MHCIYRIFECSGRILLRLSKIPNSTVNQRVREMQQIIKVIHHISLLFLVSLMFACANMDNVDSPVETNEPVVAIPNTEIYVAELSFPENKFTIGKAVNVTRNSGYDNQPVFLPGNDLFLFTSVRNNQEGESQTDIYSYSLNSQNIDRVTNTPESEYSPTLTPNSNTISVVRVDLDGEQRLWEFPIKPEVVTNDDTTLVFSDITRIGYHVWRNQNEAFLFLVDENAEGDEHTLVNAKRNQKNAELITSKIGRSLTMQPNKDALIYIDKTFTDIWNIKRYDLRTDFSEILLSTLDGSEDLVWLDDSHLLMAKDQEIYMHTIDDKYADWIKLADANSLGIQGTITRLAVSPEQDYIAIVVSE